MASYDCFFPRIKYLCKFLAANCDIHFFSCLFLMVLVSVESFPHLFCYMVVKHVLS